MTKPQDVCDHLAALAIDMPSEVDPEAGIDASILNDLKWQAFHERQEYAADLRLAWHEGDVDPVISEIESAKAAMLAAELRLRCLIAYAREFVRPRPYRLEELGRASGMSISGVRTAYEEEEIEAVAAATELKPRADEAPPAVRRRSRRAELAAGEGAGSDE